MTSLRPLCGFLGLLILVIGLCPPAPAHAHGGQFIPPPPPIGPPPPPRIPTFPTTPPSKPQGPYTPSVPGVTPPTPPPGQHPSTPSSIPTPTRRRRVAASDPNDAWQTWWAMNRWAYLPDRDAVRRGTAVTPRRGDDPTFWMRNRAEAAQAHVVPFLTEIVAGKGEERDDLRGSALLALGRTSQDEGIVDVLLAHASDPQEAVLVRESAALATGLLRRTDPSLQLDGATLDRLRDALLALTDDADAPVRVRAFAVLSIGLLGDQPFGSPYTKDGRLVIRALWQRLGGAYAHRDVPIALFVALGLQPSRGVSDAVRDGLGQIVAGRRVLTKRWDSIERGHALTTVLRLGGPEACSTLLRVLRRPREHRDVKRAAYMALGYVASRLAADQRLDVTRAVVDALTRDRDGLSRGLGHLGLAHLLRADLADPEGSPALGSTRAAQLLLSEARSGPTPSRGFSALALGLVAGEAQGSGVSRAVLVFRTEAEAVLLRELGRRAVSDDLRGAFAVAVGLAGTKAAREPLLALLQDSGATSQLRGHAAVALAQVSGPAPDVLKALHLSLAEIRLPDLRRQSALALALVGGRSAALQLIRQMRTGRTELLLAQIVVALGRLGELSTVGALEEVAKDASRSELVRSLAVVALGLLTDPEPRPSLLRLTQDAFYPARTSALNEAYSIL